MATSLARYLAILFLLFSSSSSFSPSSTLQSLSSTQSPTYSTDNFTTISGGRSSCTTVLHLFSNPFGRKRGEGDLPFVIEPVGNRSPSDRVFEDVADMCINVFFKEQLGANPDDRLPYVCGIEMAGWLDGWINESTTFCSCRLVS
jgi:hypothetical protein